LITRIKYKVINLTADKLTQIKMHVDSVFFSSMRLSNYFQQKVESQLVKAKII